MTELKKLTDSLSVASQINLDDLQAIADAGFKTIINNRPDGEEPGQPDNRQLEARANELGLAYVHQPVVSGQMTPQNIQEFQQLLEQSASPTLAFCRTGTRCTVLWAFTQADKQPAEHIIETAARAGYDLSGLAGQLR